MKNLKGTLILLLAAFIWGTAFVAQTSAGDNIGAFTFNACRNIIGALFLFIVIAILDMRKYSDRYDNLSENNYNIYKKKRICFRCSCQTEKLLKEIKFRFII